MAGQYVQECGCIALPEELQRRTGLYPGASFEFQIAEDGSSITLTRINPAQPNPTAAATICSTKENV